MGFASIDTTDVAPIINILLLFNIRGASGWRFRRPPGFQTGNGEERREEEWREGHEWQGTG